MKLARPVFHSEIRRILEILNERLERPKSNRWISIHGYSIADIAWAPFVDGWKQKRMNVSLKEFPAVEKWSDRIYGRVAVEKAYNICGAFFGDRPGYPKDA
jgi:glutathione S-transferase